MPAAMAGTRFVQGIDSWPAAEPGRAVLTGPCASAITSIGHVCAFGKLLTLITAEPFPARRLVWLQTGAIVNVCWFTENGSCWVFIIAAVQGRYSRPAGDKFFPSAGDGSVKPDIAPPMNAAGINSRLDRRKKLFPSANCVWIPAINRCPYSHWRYSSSQCGSSIVFFDSKSTRGDSVTPLRRISTVTAIVGERRLRRAIHTRSPASDERLRAG